MQVSSRLYVIKSDSGAYLRSCTYTYCAGQLTLVCNKKWLWCIFKVLYLHLLCRSAHACILPPSLVTDHVIKSDSGALYLHLLCRSAHACILPPWPCHSMGLSDTVRAATPAIFWDGPQHAWVQGGEAQTFPYKGLSYRLYLKRELRYRLSLEGNFEVQTFLRQCQVKVWVQGFAVQLL